jgi:hypothetical protein
MPRGSDQEPKRPLRLGCMYWANGTGSAFRDHRNLPKPTHCFAKAAEDSAAGSAVS